MNETTFFVIDDRELKIEQVLVEYNEAPIFFVCKNDNSYYIVLCLDLKKERYLVERVELSNLAKMLHGQISMRKVLLQPQFYWEVSVGEDVLHDVVIERKMEEVSLDDLPFEDAYLTISTNEMKRFVEKIDSLLYSKGIWEKKSIENLTMCVEEIWNATPEAYDIVIQEIYEKIVAKVSLQSNILQESYEQEICRENITLHGEFVNLQLSSDGKNILSLAA